VRDTLPVGGMAVLEALAARAGRRSGTTVGLRALARAVACDRSLLTPSEQAVAAKLLLTGRLRGIVLSVRVKAHDRERFRQAAQARGMSLHALARKALEQAITRDLAHK